MRDKSYGQYSAGNGDPIDIYRGTDTRVENQPELRLEAAIVSLFVDAPAWPTIGS